jgi:Domain of unknown function (DUF4169)
LGEIVNLRRIKKRRARLDEATAAGQARLLHGRTRQDRITQETARTRLERALDGARLDAVAARDDTDA